jgi:hypothetical protein
MLIYNKVDQIIEQTWTHRLRVSKVNNNELNTENHINTYLNDNLIRNDKNEIRKNSTNDLVSNGKRKHSDDANTEPQNKINIIL